MFRDEEFEENDSLDDFSSSCSSDDDAAAEPDSPDPLLHVVTIDDTILGDPETDQLLAVPSEPPGSVTGSSLGPDRDSIGSASDIMRDPDDEDEDEDDRDDTDEPDGDDEEDRQVTTIEKNPSRRMSLVQVTNDIMFVGHLDGNKPLLHDNDDDDESSHGDDKENEDDLFNTNTVGVSLELNAVNYNFPSHQNALRRDSTHSNDGSVNAIQRTQKSHSITNGSDLDLDAEVERILICQVIKDTNESNRSNQDLFGSKPFDQETVKVHSELNKNIVQVINQAPKPLFVAPVLPAKQQEAPVQLPVLPQPALQRLPSQKLEPKTKVQDLFGAVPFTAKKVALAGTSDPPRIVQTGSLVGPALPTNLDRNATSDVTTSNIYPILPPALQSINVAVPTVLARVKPLLPMESILDTDNPPLIPVAPKVVTKVNPETASLSSIQSSTSKPESLAKNKDKKKEKQLTNKVQKAYKVDKLEDDDDDVDGLIADDDQDEDAGLGLMGIAGSVLSKEKSKEKKDKKEKKEKKEKSKDKKEPKEPKSKEKKEKKDKKEKLKDEDGKDVKKDKKRDKSKEKHKEKPEKKSDKKDKAAKTLLPGAVGAGALANLDVSSGGGFANMSFEDHTEDSLLAAQLGLVTH